MGRGNVKPHGNIVDYKDFYISKELIHGENYYKDENYSKFTVDLESWERNLFNMIENKWSSFDKVFEFRNEDNFIICKNKFVNIEIADNQIDYMLAVVIPGYLEERDINLAYGHIRNYYKGLIKILKELYDEEYIKGKLSVRTGPWTSRTIKT